MGVTDKRTVRCEGAAPAEHPALFHVNINDTITINVEPLETAIQDGADLPAKTLDCRD